MRVTRAIVVGGHVNGLGLVRALSARGVTTCVITTAPYDIAHRSRHAAERDAVVDLADHPARLVELLERRAAGWAGAAVVPANDEALAALAQHHDRLSSTYRLLAPPESQASWVLDKTRMLAAADDVGADVPRCWGDATAANAARTDLTYPVLVKPNVGHRFRARFGTKLFAAVSRPALDAAVAALSAHGLEGRLFEFVPGPDSEIFAYCTYVDGAGEPRGGITIRKLRQSPPRFGVARMAEIVDDVPVLRDATLALLRRIGHRGIACAEFKRDARDGRFRFLEVNGRSVIYNALLRRGGLDVAHLAWADYVEERPVSATPTGWPGVWVNLHADLLHSLVRRGEDAVTFGEFLAPYRRPTIDAVWSVDDPLPFVTQWLLTGRAGASMLRHRLARNGVGSGLG